MGNFRSLRTLAALCLAGLMLGGCTLAENTEYSVTVGFGMYVTIHQPTTRGLILLRRVLANQRHVAPTSSLATQLTATVLDQNVDFNGTGAREWHDAIRNNVIPDLRDNLNTVEPTVTDAGATNSCIGFHKDLLGDINWFDRNSRDDECKVK